MKTFDMSTMKKLLTSALLATVLVFFGGVPAMVTAQQSQPISAPITASQEPDSIVPTLMIVPKLEVVADVEAVGQTPEGAMDVPTDWQDVAWYQPGFQPGENGHAAFAAHRDWDGNAGPFWELSSMEVGDLIAVADADSRVMIYVTTSNNNYGRNAEVSRQVFGLSTKPELSLITCEGNFLDAEDTYETRQVVQADLLYDSGVRN